MTPEPSKEDLEKAIDAEYRKLMQEALEAIKKEKAGLEERVKIIEQDRDSWRRCAERLEKEKTEPKLTINIEESAIKELFKNQAEELTRLKAENADLKETVKLRLREVEEEIYQKRVLEQTIDRLSSALARAHEALRYYARCVPCGGTGKTWEHDASCGDNENGDCIADHPKNKVCRGCKGKGNHCLEILSDNTGKLALERWRRMEAVVEEAKKWRSKKYVCDRGYTFWVEFQYQERDLEKALEAFDASQGGVK